jgi:hypothetical protein
MALVSVLSAGLQDIAGHKGTVVTYLPSGLTVAQISAFSDEFLSVLDEVTAAQIVSASVALAIDLPVGLKVAPMAGQYIQLGANFGFVVANSAYRYSQRVPAIREALLVGDAVDMTDNAVIDYAGGMTTGVTPALPTDQDGGDLTAVISGTATFRKS